MDWCIFREGTVPSPFLDLTACSVFRIDSSGVPIISQELGEQSELVPLIKGTVPVKKTKKS